MTADNALDPPRASEHAVTRVHMGGPASSVSFEDGATLANARVVDCVRAKQTGGVMLVVEVICPHGVEFCGADGAIIPASEVFPEPARLVVPDRPGMVRVRK